MEEYKSREYCKDIECPTQKILEEADRVGNGSVRLYLKDCKKECKHCEAYHFHNWLQKNGYKIVKMDNDRRSNIIYRYYTDQDLIECIEKKAQELNRTPKIKDMREDYNMPSVNTFKYHFGSWEKALNAAGYTSRYTKEKLIHILQDFSKEIGRKPKTKDMIYDNRIPSQKTFKKYFGKWSNALKAAGFKPYGNQEKRGEL